MGTKGATGLRSILIGSQAVSLIKNLNPAPLFLVPKNAEFKLLKNRAYATDLKDEYKEYDLTFLKELVKHKHANLHVVHVYNPSKTAAFEELHYEDLKIKLKDVPYTTHWMASEKKTEEVLTDFCKTHHINLLILRHHQFCFLKTILNTLLVETVSFRSKLPLLIFPVAV
jgi:hypothetical protein